MDTLYYVNKERFVMCPLKRWALINGFYSTVQINWDTCGKLKKTQFSYYSTLLAQK